MTARALSGMPMDAYRVGDNFVAHFDLPGVDPGSIDLSVEGNTLTVSAERSVPQLENAEWTIAERPFGSYTRQLVLGRSLDTDRLEASYHDGVLTLSIPVAEKAQGPQDHGDPGRRTRHPSRPAPSRASPRRTARRSRADRTADGRGRVPRTRPLPCRTATGEEERDHPRPDEPAGRSPTTRR